MLTDVIGPVSWDFDNDGDVDIAGSSIGPLYVGGTHTVWANDGKGNFTVKWCAKVCLYDPALKRIVPLVDISDLCCFSFR